MSKQQTVPPPLTPEQKNQWNNFIDFLDKQGVKGSPMLDDKDKQLGNYYFQKYKALNPGITLTYNDVPRVQQGLQDYRTKSLVDIHSGKVNAGINNDDEFMPSLSPVDGWLGSKTSSHKFPVATETIKTPTGTTVKNYGTDTDSFELAGNTKK